jgi:hypothetical protein
MTVTEANEQIFMVSFPNINLLLQKSDDECEITDQTVFPFAYEIFSLSLQNCLPISAAEKEPEINVRHICLRLFISASGPRGTNCSTL